VLFSEERDLGEGSGATSVASRVFGVQRAIAATSSVDGSRKRSGRGTGTTKGRHAAD